MCNRCCIEFVRHHLGKDDVQGKTVLEVGALDVNGTVRPLVEALGPKEYLGVDIEMGPGVDEICDAHDLLERFGEGRFDVVLSTELLEHVRDWRRVVAGFKRVLKPGGVLLVTTRSMGHPYHGYPSDFWRYEPADMEALFSDFDIEALEPDPVEPGVFLKARKPESFTENALSGHALFAIIKNRRVERITPLDAMRFRVGHSGRRVVARTRYLVWDTLCTIAPAPLKRVVKRCIGLFVKQGE